MSAPVAQPTTGPARIQAAFDRTAAEDRAALIVYLTACYPDADT